MLFALVMILALAAPAQAVTLRDLIDLSRAGLSDEILIALVEAEKSVFQLNAVDVQELKRQGLSDRLLIHLLQTPALREEAARANQVFAVVTSPPREPEVVVIDRVETVAVPVYVPVPVAAEPAHPPSRPRPAPPVYWGYGGKLRPDAWGQPAGRQRPEGRGQTKPGGGGKPGGR
jgi:hypothetical protein